MPSSQSLPAAPAETTGSQPVSEQTPLLADRAAGPVEVQEPSTKRLLLVLGSIWLGVFLAALGMAQSFLSQNTRI
jgi:hypothetical protein